MSSTGTSFGDDLVGAVLERGNGETSERLQERDARKTGDLRSATLGDEAELEPLDRGG